ncbi:MAG: hypothetical protein K1X82_01925 [Bacteroidia bacterium]|nr:hypothetical protein [Bacteroidia bacterium]
MLKDIPNLLVEDVALAVVKEQNMEGEEVYNVYVINLKNRDLEAVLVSSSGYGIIQEKEVKTSELRHFLETVPARSASKVEAIVEDVFGITNQYWLSFYLDKQIYDKKYIFLPESIREENFIVLPILQKKGVMIL